MSDSYLLQRFLRCHVLLVYLNFIALWNSSSHFIFQSSASELPESEVSSLNTMTQQLKMQQLFSTSYCTNPIPAYGYTISCKCDNMACHINQIKFSGMRLTGTISASIGDLSKLTIIDLSNNKLQGPIPDSLGNLPDLQTLDLTRNQLTGKIPDSLGNLKSLQGLYLQYNYLSGAIPSTLSQLSKLQSLLLDYNRLSGSIPKQLGQLKSLEILSLGENKLTGRLPVELGNLINLMIFWMPSNNLVGELPNYEKLVKLTRFVLAGNQLSGELPSYADKWPKLSILSLHGNKFQGPVPISYFQLPNLYTLSISDLTVTDTSEFKFPEKANLPRIQNMVLRRCSLIGPIPDYIGEMSTLKYLDLSFNRLIGRVPDSISQNLIYLSLARNNLNGTIPNWIFQSSGSRMDLSYNNFSNLASPAPSDIDLNLFSCCGGGVSPTTEPYMLHPHDMMNYYFPKKKSQFYSLYINSGGDQTHSNKTSYDGDNSTSYFHISPAHNWAYSFSGDYLVATANSSDYIKRVPCKITASQASLYDDARISPVSLNYYGLGLYKGRYNVTLHFAEIVYVNDEDYSLLRKRIFDIYIQGKLVMEDFNIRDYAGGPNKATSLTFATQVSDSHLLDIHLSWTGKGSYFDWPAFNGPLISAISVNPLFKVADEKLAIWQIVLIAVASLVVALLLLLALAWLMGWLENKELKEKVKVGEFVDNSVKKDIKVQLKKVVAATENFSDGKRIGKSGFLGSVYKAEVLKDSGITVAVKKLHPHHKGKITGLIRKEIGHMTKLEGENIIKLLDVHMGKKLQLLIYEYMENESLETALFQAKFETIPWKTRVGICVGVAKGLESLHNHPGKIVHGNIKASNILLDKDYKPKLSDFGFASVYTEEDQFSVIRQEAPRGYLAHEYCQGDNPTFKTDIYSFGVVLMEIVAGKKNKEVIAQQESTDLVNQVHKHFEDKRTSIKDLVDKKFADDHDIDEQAEEILRLAVKCTSQPSLRPEISEIVRVLDNADKKAAEEKWPPKFTTLVQKSGSSA